MPLSWDPKNLNLQFSQLFSSVGKSETCSVKCRPKADHFISLVCMRTKSANGDLFAATEFSFLFDSVGQFYRKALDASGEIDRFTNKKCSWDLPKRLLSSFTSLILILKCTLTYWVNTQCLVLKVPSKPMLVTYIWYDMIWYDMIQYVHWPET